MATELAHHDLGSAQTRYKLVRLSHERSNFIGLSRNLRLIGDHKLDRASSRVGFLDLIGTYFMKKINSTNFLDSTGEDKIYTIHTNLQINA